MSNIDNLIFNVDINKESNNIKIPTFDRGYTSKIVISILIFLTILSGAIYILLQWHFNKIIYDSIFVSMLIGASMILIFGLERLSNYIIKKGLNFCVFLLSKTNTKDIYERYETLCKSVLNFRGMTIVGIIYGFTVGSAPFILGVWNSNITLKISLSIFMFFVNFITGIAFYSLITFFLQSFKLGRLVKVNLWQVNNPSTDFFIDATRKISILASIYISISLSSILFSILPISGLIIGYSVFSGIIIISALFVPSMPVVKKLKEAKISALYEIDKQLYLSFYRSLDELKPSKTDIDYEKVKTLLELREKVDNINIWPFRMKSIFAGISVIFFSSVPVILQIILSKLLD